MLKINALLFMIIVELLCVFIGLTIFFIFRVKKLKKINAAQQQEINDIKKEIEKQKSLYEILEKEYAALYAIYKKD